MTNEKQGSSLKGWYVVALHLLLVAAMAWIFVAGANVVRWTFPQILAILILLIVSAAILPPGYFTLQPNEAKVLVLFGRYKGTVRSDGFHWTNPLQLAQPRGKYTVSQRIRNFEIEKLKVNDKRGNPIEIAAVVVWRVVDTAHALFDVDHYEHYVKIQSDAALRHLANCYPYDHGEEEDEMTLRSGMDEVALVLKKELQERLAQSRACRSTRRGSPTWPTPPRSPTRCCAASRPRPSSPPAARSSTARSPWWRWRWKT